MKETFRYRVPLDASTTARVGQEERAVCVDVEPSGALQVQVTSAELPAGSIASWRVLRSEGARLQLVHLADGRRVNAYVVCERERIHVHVDGRAYTLERGAAKVSRRGGARGAATPGLEAPMPGQVRAVLVAEGAQIAEGDTVVVLEAMKMELRVRAPHAGRVAKIACAVGDVVERGQLLALLG